MSPARARARHPVRNDTERGRFYTLADGTRLASVTTVLQALNKPALLKWAANTVAEEAVSNLPTLVRRSRTDASDTLVKWLAGQPFARRDEAAAAGTKAHALAEAHVLNQPAQGSGGGAPGGGVAAADPDSPVGQTLAQFERFLAEWSPEFQATEAIVANRTYGYAGTLDAIARFPCLVGSGSKVVDYKTGKTGPWPEWALQTVAYQRCEELWLPNGKSVPMPKTDGVMCLRLRPDGYALHELVGDLDPLFDTFVALLDVAAFLRLSEDESPWSPKLPAPTLEVTCPS